VCCPAGSFILFFFFFTLLSHGGAREGVGGERVEGGGIINPTLKTACRDRARFRRDSRPAENSYSFALLSPFTYTLFSLIFCLALPRRSSLSVFSPARSVPPSSCDLYANARLTARCGIPSCNRLRICSPGCSNPPLQRLYSISGKDSLYNSRLKY